MSRKATEVTKNSLHDEHSICSVLQAGAIELHHIGIVGHPSQQLHLPPQSPCSKIQVRRCMRKRLLRPRSCIDAMFTTSRLTKCAAIQLTNGWRRGKHHGRRNFQALMRFSPRVAGCCAAAASTFSATFCPLTRLPRYTCMCQVHSEGSNEEDYYTKLPTVSPLSATLWQPFQLQMEPCTHQASCSSSDAFKRKNLCACFASRTEE